MPLPPSHPMSSVGQQLQQARVARKLTVEDAAFKTHIPHQHLRDLENDDFTNFANPTYAKGFLKLYSRFLNIDLGDTLDDFAPSAPPGRPLQTHLQDSHPSRVLNPSRMSTTRRAARRNRSRTPRLPWDKIALLAFLLAAAYLIFKPAKPTPNLSIPPPSPQAAPTPPTLPTPSAQSTPKPSDLPEPEAEPESAPEPTPLPQPEPEATPVPEAAGQIRRATVVEDEPAPSSAAPLPR